MSCGFVCYASGRIDPTQFFYNMCLSFAAVPSLAQLKTAVEERVATDNCVPDGSIFRVGDVEILDFRLGMWVALESRKQMYSGCQLNIIRSLTTASAAGMADRAFKPPQERAMAFAYEAQLLFEALDIDNEGKLRLPGFLRAYRDNVDFAVEVFSVLDTKVEGHIEYRDFLALSKEEDLESLFIEMKRRLATHGAPLVLSSSDDEEGQIEDHFTFGGRKKKRKNATNNVTKSKRSKGTKFSPRLKTNKKRSSSFSSSLSASSDDESPSEDEEGYYSDSSYAAYRRWKRNRKNKSKKEKNAVVGQRGGQRVGLFDDFNLEDIAVNKTGQAASYGGIDGYGLLFRGGVANGDGYSENLNVGAKATRGVAPEKNVETRSTADRSHRTNASSTSNGKSPTATRIRADGSQVTEKLSNSNRGGNGAVRPRSAGPLHAGSGSQSPSSAAASPSSSGKDRRLSPAASAVAKSHTGRSSKTSTLAPPASDVFSRLTSSLAADSLHNNNNNNHQAGGMPLHASTSSPQLSRATSGGSGGRRSIGGGTSTLLTTSPSTAIPIPTIGSFASSSPTGSGGVSYSPLTNAVSASSPAINTNTNISNKGGAVSTSTSAAPASLSSSSPPSFSAGVKRAILNAAREKRQQQQKESEELKLRQALTAIGGGGGDASKDKGGMPPLTPQANVATTHTGNGNGNNDNIYGGGDGAPTSKQQQEKALLVIEKLKALAKRRGE